VWYWARRDGVFFLVGVEGPASFAIGPLLPAISAGLTAALTLLLADAAVGPVTGVVAAVVLLLLPGFLPLHRGSLLGPPELALILLMLTVMVHAPRFSLAYGILAAVAAVFVSADALALPIVAALWALWPKLPGNRRRERVALALLPSLGALAISHWIGGVWRHPVMEWHGGLDRVLRSAGAVVGDQLVPTIGNPALRFFAIADLSVLLVAVIVVAWRRRLVEPAETSVGRRLYPAAGLLAAGSMGGVLLRDLLQSAAPEPGLPQVMPLVVLTVVVGTVSLSTLWRTWPRWGKGIALLIVLGWVQAAFRA
jgi:hypothetical protein